MIEFATDGTTELKFEDDEFESIVAIKEILENKAIDVEKITPNLAYFADKYEIQFLLQICCFYFCTLPVTVENIFDMVKIAMMADHDKLFRKISTFFDKNRGVLNTIPGLKEFMQKNSQYSGKIFNALMF